MDPAVLQEKVVTALRAHCPGEKEQDMLHRLETVHNMLSAWSAWDGVPAHLDTSFSMKDIRLAINELADHHEEEGASSMQHNNAVSLLITARSMMGVLPELPRVSKVVRYI